ncbi:proline iminopeptidase-family hydrolase [Alicyclobacillus sp. SP_1]|jgi:proline iminopeptidase|uniref:proline iminopeptidase-family hydrolase n=1 Tax=Alicyclobacillus sp. SP_1 TaxID=2942475 RepID=UPI0021574244|nr:proline iminopeptidase-family hydrolase [Alicyclobacillus sp. SP_1]
MYQEGFVNVTGGRVWYRQTGRTGKAPLLALHGGPGSSHLSLSILETIGDDRPVILYDQLGCGFSQRPTDASLWRMERFVEELATVRSVLNLDTVHLFGHSFGTMLLADYLIKEHPSGVQSAIFSGPCLSAKRWLEDAHHYRSELPVEIQATLLRCEESGQTNTEEYREASKAYERLHVCRLERTPEERAESARMFGADVYNAMWGPSEFCATGNLRDFDCTADLHKLEMPCLFTCGRYDEASPASTAYYKAQVSRSELHIFENSAHVPMREEPEEFVRVIREFLRRHDE